MISIQSLYDELEKIAAVKNVAKSLIKVPSATNIPELKNVRGFGSKAPLPPSVPSTK